MAVLLPQAAKCCRGLLTRTQYLKVRCVPAPPDEWASDLADPSNSACYWDQGLPWPLCGPTRVLATCKTGVCLPQIAHTPTHTWQLPSPKLGL